MALLWFDGFDSYNNLNSYIATRGGTETGGAMNKTIGRFNNMGYYSGWDVGSSILLPSEPTEIWTGKAIRMNGEFGTTTVFAFYYETPVWIYAVPEVRIQLDGTTGKFSAQRGNTVLLGSSAERAFSQFGWHWVEAHFKLGTTDGIVELYVDGVKVLDIGGTTPTVNTKYTLAATGVRAINSTSGSNNTIIDDLYILDTTGSAPWNTRLGDCKIVSLKVNSDATPNNGTTSNGSAQHYTTVDDMPIGYDTADYVRLQNTTGQKEKFGISSFTDTASTIFGVSVVSVCKKSDAGDAAFHNTTTVNNVEYPGSSKITTDSWAIYRDDFVLNPGTSSQWTASDVTNSTIGITIE